MSDNFDAHEILSKLRAKSGFSGDGSAASSNGSPTRSGARSVGQSSRSIKGPSSLTLTPAQRQDNLDIRNELEREIKKLQLEVQALRAENNQIRGEKEDIARQFLDHKIKTEDIVTKLRGRLAAASLGKGGEKNAMDRGKGAGKLYSPSPVSAQQARQQVREKLNFYHKDQRDGPVYGGGNYNTGYTNPPGYRDPTFNELLRRQTPEYPEFQDNLRSDVNRPVSGGKVRTAPNNSNAHSRSRNHEYALMSAMQQAHHLAMGNSGSGASMFESSSGSGHYDADGNGLQQQYGMEPQTDVPFDQYATQQWNSPQNNQGVRIGQQSHQQQMYHSQGGQGPDLDQQPRPGQTNVPFGGQPPPPPHQQQQHQPPHQGQLSQQPGQPQSQQQQQNQQHQNNSRPPPPPSVSFSSSTSGGGRGGGGRGDDDDDDLPVVEIDLRR